MCICAYLSLGLTRWFVVVWFVYRGIFLFQVLSLYCSLLFQSILPLLESDLYEICLACAEGTLHQHLPQFTRDLYTSGVVLASGGYPGGYKKGLPISGIQMFHRFYVIVWLFHLSKKKFQRNLEILQGLLSDFKIINFKLFF